METYKINIKGDNISAIRAQAEAGAGYAAIAKDYVKIYKTIYGCVRVILISKDGHGKRVQKTYYCAKINYNI